MMLSQGDNCHINPWCKQFDGGERTIVEIGSQDDPEFLAGLSRKYSPTIIIDDGSHLAHHVTYTYEHLFPFLQPGGLYVIEDIFFHLGPHAEQYRGQATVKLPVTPLMLIVSPTANPSVMKVPKVTRRVNVAPAPATVTLPS